MVEFCLHTSGWEFDTLILLVVVPPKVSGSFGGDIFTCCVGVDGYTGSCEVKRDGKTIRAAMVTEEKVLVGLLSTTSGTLAVLKRLETPLQDPQSAVSE